MFQRPVPSTRPFWVAIVAIFFLLSTDCRSVNAQYPMPPSGQPTPYPGQAPQQQQQPQSYAFRPNLTNPEYGQCLNLEKRWRNIYQSYYSMYNQARMMNPSDPQYAQTANYVNYLRSQVDAAWAEFSGKCVYFPEHR